ncbi:uncharacterized protein FIESC28_10122 [Fusarium coffeatum]|uniref:Uncharacterized protein n=1 Tax=Fusarium coffeatum TaxID=231269 RepID=A0A366QW46_9HYPO|nr:uncharacterized protein FIESC28_10122 [Fusarium coffeatum]RBR08942.1 hypothetical protein FIESC28_10122 [Fusarium coffeatum]
MLSAMRFFTGLTTLIAISGASALSLLPQRERVRCVADDKTGALFVTADCVDPNYDSPILDNETDETIPTPHRRISGHFNGTDVDFNIYLTPKSKWERRFFQLMYPLQTSIAEDDAIKFGVESGGYTIQASGTIGYRADAALAKLSRQIAQEYYNTSSGQIRGYVYGGSGGSLKVIGAAENTLGVWDGCVALVQATPMSIPYDWGIRALGGLILEKRAKEVIDAVQPGGSGDPYEVLDELERAVLIETQHLGVPTRAWEDWESIANNRTQLWQTLKDTTVPILQRIDPTYADDFWNKDGYAGCDQSALGERFRAALVRFDSAIETVTAGHDGLISEFVLKTVPGNVTDVVGFGFSVRVNGSRSHFSGMLDVKTRTVHILAGASNTTLGALVPGARIQVDNRWYLATHTYHRHQLPPEDSGFYGYDYLRDENGEPRYPQRDILMGPIVSKSASGGGTHTVNITMKLIVMDNLLDFDALPWHADWYKNQVLKAKGSLEDHYRLYYSDNADHVMGKVKAPHSSRVVDFTGLYQQHLRDMMAWVENNVTPPTPTNYTVVEGQVKVPLSVSARKGIQPVVELFVDNSKRAHVAPGEIKEFHVKAQVPDGVGQIVALEWDPLGIGEYTKIDIDVGPEVDLRFSCAYKRPGVYFAGVRAASHRDGNTETEIALAWNLDRVRVVVESRLVNQAP